MDHPPTLADAVGRARRGDAAACRELVVATEAMVRAVARRVVGDPTEALDVAQDAYLIALRRLDDLVEDAAFPGWLRRIVIGVARNRLRRRRATWLAFDDAADTPVLDEAETAWSEAQRRQLARALATLTPDERRLCDRRYHGGWTPERLAEDAGIEPAAMRKRLQRIRDKLREEIEMDEHENDGDARRGDLPATVVDLLARPRLVDLPGNPVGATLAALRGPFAGYDEVELPEIVDLDDARARLGGDAVYIDRATLHRVAGERVLRYDLSLPMLLATRWRGRPLRRAAAGKVYRREQERATHLEAFHQAEMLVIEERSATAPWAFAGAVLQAIDAALPRAEVRVAPTEYPMCARAWSLDVQQDGRWIEVMAYGEYADWVLRALGADPRAQIALGAGFGLERIAGLRYGIDDVRKIAASRVG